MKNDLEITRNNTTPQAFLTAVKKRCGLSGMACGIDLDVFENPAINCDDTYFVRDGKKYSRYGAGEATREYNGTDAPALAETFRIKPYDYQCYIKNHDGSGFNEICEFTFDDEKRGHGYYYQENF